MATMSEVARLAGVSVATVSFVVNDTKPVTPATRARVESAMQQLGFRRNVLARALASQRTRIIAIAFPSDEHRLGSTALSIITSAAIAAADRGHSVVLWPVGYEDGRLEEYVRGGLVDAVLLMEVVADDPRIPVLERLNVPFGLIGRTAADETRSFVDLDFAQAAVDGIAHLRELGHERIALVVGETPAGSRGGYGPVLRTTEAYDAAMRELGLEPVIVHAPSDPVGGLAAAEALAAQHPDVTGVLVLNEAALFGFLAGITRSGYRVPDDISVLGIATSAENVAIASPVLSTIVAAGEQVGVLAVGGMIDVLEGGGADAAPHLLVRCELRPAESTAAAPSPRPRPTQTLEGTSA
jgi:DNA-binding LacI/PurR family transcriptional regulator